MIMDNDAQAYRAEIVVRSLAPHGVNERQRTIIERIEEFREQGLLAAVDIDVWGQEIRADPDVWTDAHERYAALEAWAEGHEYTLAPGFDRRERNPITADGANEVIRFPLICLVLSAIGERSREEAVRAVFPCSDDEQTYTILDGIEALSQRAALGELKDKGSDDAEIASEREVPKSTLEQL